MTPQIWLKNCVQRSIPKEGWMNFLRKSTLILWFLIMGLEGNSFLWRKTPEDLIVSHRLQKRRTCFPSIYAWGWKRNTMNPQINRALMELTKESPKQGCWLSCEGEDIISLEEVNSNIWLLKLWSSHQTPCSSKYLKTKIPWGHMSPKLPEALYLQYLDILTERREEVNILNHPLNLIITLWDIFCNTFLNLLYI